MEHITAGVGGFINGFLGFFRDMPGKLVAALSGAGTWLLGIGRNIIEDGLINGISGAAGAVAPAIVNLVPEAIRGPIEAALGIHSPSRVAMWWGDMIGEGLPGGIGGSRGQVAASMEVACVCPGSRCICFARIYPRGVRFHGVRIRFSVLDAVCG